MGAPTAEDILGLLRGVVDPELGSDIVDLGMVRDVDVDGDDVRLVIALTTIGCPLQAQIKKDIQARLGDVDVTWTEMTPEEKANCMAKARFNATQRAGETMGPATTTVIASEAGAGVRVVVDPASADLLKGAVLDFKDGLQGAGFSIENPNATRSCGCGQSFS